MLNISTPIASSKSISYVCLYLFYIQTLLVPLRGRRHILPHISYWMTSERANLPFVFSLFLVLGMTGHDDTVACAHNVSLQSTSVILRTSKRYCRRLAAGVSWLQWNGLDSLHMRPHGLLVLFVHFGTSQICLFFLQPAI